MKPIKKLLSITSIIAVFVFAVHAPFVRAEVENEHEDARVTNSSLSHNGEKETESEQGSKESHVKTFAKKIKKTKKIKKAKRTKKSKKQDDSAKSNTGTSSVTASTSTDSSSVISYSMDQVAAANNKLKCWTTINGNVYDLTTWIAQHPGGQGAILSLCGKDGTNAFNAQHGGQVRPEQELKHFFIGKLK